MTDVTAFIRARLDEWEAAATATRDREWSTRSGLQVRGASGTVACWDCCGGDPHASEPEQVHIAAHDPASVLRQVAALRAVVDLSVLPAVPPLSPDPEIMANAEGIVKDLKESREAARRELAQAGEPPRRADSVLCRVASIWADHPDFDRRWA